MFRGMPNPRERKCPNRETACFKLWISANTSPVFQSIWKNMTKKKIRNPYLNHLLFIHRGTSFFRERPKRPPIRPKSCPLPQYRLQYPFVPFAERDDQRDEKTKKSDPCKQDVEKSENQISEGYDPQIVIPMFFHDGPPKSLFY